MSEVIITVRGESEERVVPERAVAHVSVVVDGPAREQVVARVSDLAGPIREDLDARRSAGQVLTWSSSRASVWSDRPWNADGRVLDLVHHASVEITAAFTDFSELSDWLNTLAEHEGIQVGPVEWGLSPETRAEVERRVAVDAVAVAVERATAYGSAVGRHTITPVEIADLGLLAPGAPLAAARSLAKASMEMDAGGAIDARPDMIVISAAVEARFRAS